MNTLTLFTQALGHLLEISALIQPKAEIGSVIEAETAFMWNHANNVAMLGADFRYSSRQNHSAVPFWWLAR